MENWLIIGALVLIGLSWLALILPPGWVQNLVGLIFGLGMLATAFVGLFIGASIWICLCIGFAGATLMTLSIVVIRKDLR